eukprot:TRINITY_DN66942_c9_g1_i4.p1 TRINITY_DN66942_c9_g1~~TRINITY_DN66942_c9_g1_i4.p1  ORF type:complete len:260 (+),score=149.01 TRINITY_DN66942_c9_g1_i4:628-1407(+)
MCMVFEPMSMNLRQVIKKFGSVGIDLRAVRVYAAQLFSAAGLLRDCNILHGDIKPDNILVNEAMNALKVCDLGSAGRISECEITPYLVSRFYRAPEIIIGNKYNEKADMWSIGCVLFELYTGRILFSGRDNNDMLRVMQEVKGPFSPKMLRQGAFAKRHFDPDQDWAFQQELVDVVTQLKLVRIRRFTKPTRSILSMLHQAAPKHVAPEERRRIRSQLELFADLLERCLMLNPEKRISVDEAMNHQFFAAAVASAAASD